MAVSVTDISEAGIGLLSLFGGFLKGVAPPSRAIIKWTGLASVIAGLAFLIVKLVARMSAHHAAVMFWGFVACASVVLSIALWLIYFFSLQSRTVDYAGQTILAGNEYTPAAEKYRAAHPAYTSEQIVNDYGGKINEVWTPESLQQSNWILGIEYAVSVACLAFTLNLGLEVLNNTWTNSPPPSPPPPPTLQQRAAALTDVHFELDKSALQQDASERLADDAALLTSIFQQFPKAKVIVEGHCDDRGSLQRNLALGFARARAVGDALVHDGIPADRLQFASYGKGSPLCTEATEQCMRKNRRVHLTLVE